MEKKVLQMNQDNRQRQQVNPANMKVDKAVMDINTLTNIHGWLAAAGMQETKAKCEQAIDRLISDYGLEVSGLEEYAPPLPVTIPTDTPPANQPTEGN